MGGFTPIGGFCATLRSAGRLTNGGTDVRTRNLAAALVAAVALLATSGATAATAAPASAAPAATSRYIVTLDGGTADVAATAAGLVHQLGAGDVVATYGNALRGFLVELPAPAAAALAALPGVAGVEADGVVSLDATQPTPPSYGIDRIDQRARPLSGSYGYTSTGAGVRAYIIDTGIHATHVDFSGRVVAGTNTVDASPSTTDCNGHGTHVSGTVGGETYGVAKDVTLVAVRVFGCGNSTSTSAIIAGVDWVTGNHQAGQPAVANMSLGGGASAALDTAVRGMIADGVTTAIASGNDGANGCGGSPAAVAEGIVTGATDRNDARASFSNFGTCVDVHAPGVDIISASPSSNTASATLSGTSMATPHVTGAAARYLQGNPGASPAAVQAAIVGAATTGAISGIATTCTFLQNLLGTCTAGTPNRLLYVDPAQ